jgi:hypothetical protein
MLSSPRPPEALDGLIAGFAICVKVQGQESWCIQGLGEGYQRKVTVTCGCGSRR